MSVNGKTLDTLAVRLGEHFLKAGNSGKIINLSGHTPEVLEYLKERMEVYFAEKKEDVLIVIGYPINVDFFT